MPYSRMQFIQKICRLAARTALHPFSLEDESLSICRAQCSPDFDPLASEIPKSLLILEAERLDLDAVHLDEEKLRAAIGRWMRSQHSEAASEEIQDAF